MKTIRLFVLTLALLVFTPIVYAQEYDFYLQKARQRIAEGDCEGAQRNYNVYMELAKKTNKEIERKLADCGSDNSTLVYSQLSEYYCDGVYDFDEPEDRNGHALHTPELMINRNHFRIVFAFKALSYTANAGGPDPEYIWINEYQWPMMLSSSYRIIGVCLYKNGTISITTNNGRNHYETDLTYSIKNYTRIDMEYNHGQLTINGQRLSIYMDTEGNWDNRFHSVNYSSGTAFKGYIKDIST